MWKMDRLDQGVPQEVGIGFVLRSGVCQDQIPVRACHDNDPGNMLIRCKSFNTTLFLPTFVPLWKVLFQRVLYESRWSFGLVIWRFHGQARFVVYAFNVGKQLQVAPAVPAVEL